MQRAILDENGVLTGFEAIKGKPKAGDVTVPDDCDLTPGKYRWDGATFHFIRAATADDLVAEPHTLRAIARGFAAIDKALPGVLPADTKAWLKWFDQTVDAKADFDRDF